MRYQPISPCLTEGLWRSSQLHILSLMKSFWSNSSPNMEITLLTKFQSIMAQLARDIMVRYSHFIVKERVLERFLSSSGWWYSRTVFPYDHRRLSLPKHILIKYPITLDEEKNSFPKLYNVFKIIIIFSEKSLSEIASYLEIVKPGGRKFSRKKQHQIGAFRTSEHAHTLAVELWNFLNRALWKWKKIGVLGARKCSISSTSSTLVFLGISNMSSPLSFATFLYASLY